MVAEANGPLQIIIGVFEAALLVFALPVSAGLEHPARDPLRPRRAAGPDRRRGLTPTGRSSTRVRVILDPREHSDTGRLVGLEVRRKPPGPVHAPQELRGRR